jgi:RNA polymerase sigma-70 factor (ECF subfamily)
MNASIEQLQPSSTDEHLLASHLQGDQDAFAQIVGRYQRDLYRFLFRFLGNSASADDVFQETFVQVFQSANQFEPGRSFRPWLFTIAANKARDHLRSRARKKTSSLQATIDPHSPDGNQYIDLMSAVDSSPSEGLEYEELQHRVNEAMSRLPDNLREVIVLAYFNQMPYKQIAEVLKVPLGTVKSRLHTAVESFANIWKSANPVAG